MYKGISHHMVQNNLLVTILTIKTKVYFTILLVNMSNNVM